jgi:tRNA-splicing ligase RtcB (3'-phosphate/5'-hydroxy nucleic acid ligase)
MNADIPTLRCWIRLPHIANSGGADEAPLAYKRLTEVLAHHGDTIKVLHTLRPVGVAMAGANEVDPYKD